jgi:hypothetical protein
MAYHDAPPQPSEASTACNGINAAAAMTAAVATLLFIFSNLSPFFEELFPWRGVSWLKMAKKCRERSRDITSRNIN